MNNKLVINACQSDYSLPLPSLISLPFVSARYITSLLTRI